MDSRLSRFTYCDKRFHPYLEKVLNQMPDDVRDNILENRNLQILSDDNFHSSGSLFYRFDESVTHLIYLNTATLKQPVFDINYTIAFEFAKLVTETQHTAPTSRDREAKKMLVEWNFIMDTNLLKPKDPIEESEGYQLGYGWAKKQKQDDLLWNYRHYFDEWNEERISPERFEQLYIDVAPFSILEQMSPDKTDPEATKDGDLLEAGIICGVMAAIKELVDKNSKEESP